MSLAERLLRTDATYVSFMQRSGAAPKQVRAIAVSEDQQAALDRQVKDMIGIDDFHWSTFQVLDADGRPTHISLPGEVHAVTRTSKEYSNPDLASKVHIFEVFNDLAAALKKAEETQRWLDRSHIAVITFPVGTGFIQ